MTEKAIIRQFSRKLRGALMKQVLPVLKYDYDAITDTTLKYILDSKPLKAVLVDMYRAAGLLGYKIDRGQKGILDDIVEAEFLVYAEQIAGKRITWLTAETEKLILDITRDAVSQGISQGWGRDKIAQYFRSQLREQYGVISRYRSVMIAQTETNAAVNYGSLQSAKDAGVTMHKIWVAGGGDSRPAHLAANGQEVGLDEPFLVGGERLMHPGDSWLGATAGNVINCRCRQIYKRVNVM